jgi:hypothetical protein
MIDYSRFAATDLKAKVLNPFQDATAKPATDGTAFGAKLMAGDIPVFLLGLFSKGEKDNLSKAERNELRKELAGLAADYRACVRKRVTKIKSRSTR